MVTLSIVSFKKNLRCPDDWSSKPNDGRGDVEHVGADKLVKYTNTSFTNTPTQNTQIQNIQTHKYDIDARGLLWV